MPTFRIEWFKDAMIENNNKNLENGYNAKLSSVII